MTLKIECTNCGASEELPENFSIKRLVDTGKQFQHRPVRKVEGVEKCREENLFVRTFSV